ncbi:hypothetical protein ACFE04_021558 [Oxalis oulophora]
MSYVRDTGESGEHNLASPPSAGGDMGAYVPGTYKALESPVRLNGDEVFHAFTPNQGMRTKISRGKKTSQCYSKFWATIRELIRIWEDPAKPRHSVTTSPTASTHPRPLSDYPPTDILANKAGDLRDDKTPLIRQGPIKTNIIVTGGNLFPSTSSYPPIYYAECTDQPARARRRQKGCRSETPYSILVYRSAQSMGEKRISGNSRYYSNDIEKDTTLYILWTAHLRTLRNEFQERREPIVNATSRNSRFQEIPAMNGHFWNRTGLVRREFGDKLTRKCRLPARSKWSRVVTVVNHL